MTRVLDDCMGGSIYSQHNYGPMQSCSTQDHQAFLASRSIMHTVKIPKNPRDLDLWPMTLKFNRVLEVVEIHVRTELYQAECSGSRITSFLPYLAMGKNLLIRSCDLDPWPWKSIGFVLLSRYMFMQNFIQLSAVVHESSYVQRKKNKKHNCPPSLPQTVINKSEKYDRNFFYFLPGYYECSGFEFESWGSESQGFKFW